MPIYTGGGDDGTTALFGGERVAKHALRMELIGTIDELSATLGMAVVRLRDEETANDAGDPARSSTGSPTQNDASTLAALIQRIQSELFIMGADVATPHEPRAYTIPRITLDHAATLEAAIDAADSELAPLTDFVLPGGTHCRRHAPFCPHRLPPYRTQRGCPGTRGRTIQTRSDLPQPSLRLALHPRPPRQPTGRHR